MTELIRDRIADLIVAGMEAAQEAGDLPPFDLPQVSMERPRQAEHGDYATPVCLQLAKEARMPPRKIAESVAAHLPSAPFVERIEVAGPGYLNVRLSPGWLVAQVEVVLEAGKTFGNVDVGQGLRYQVEHVSANPTGALHVGAARNAVIGDTLANLLQAAGYDVEREYYVNDAGSQIRHFGESLYARYLQALGRDEPFPENGYQGQYVVEMGAEIAREEGERYLDVDRQEAIRSLGAEGIARIIEVIRRDLVDLRVRFDTWFHEKSLHDSGTLDRVLDTLREKGHIVEREGAVWYTADDLDADAVVIRSPQIIPVPEERPTYFASDIAYAWNKLVERGFDKAIYVWGADHHGDVPRVKSAAAALGLDPDRVVIILYQLVRLKRGGEEVKMSKRTGEFITLRELLDEVGPDPIRFFLLTSSIDAAMDFDLDLAVEQSEKNPVFYVQYAHARIANILRHATEQGWDVEKAGDVSLLSHESELALIRKILDLQEVVAAAATQLAPHYLTTYAKELASSFHSFYRDCRVVQAEAPELTRARLMLTRAARLALARALTLIGVGAPERM